MWGSKKFRNSVEDIIYNYDLSILDNCYKLYDECKDMDIDVLVNGAGFGLFGNTWETDLDKELNMINLNIIAVHILTKLFLKRKMYTKYLTSTFFQGGPKRQPMTFLFL